MTSSDDPYLGLAAEEEMKACDYLGSAGSARWSTLNHANASPSRLPLMG